MGPVTFAEKVILHHLLSHTVGKLLRIGEKKKDGKLFAEGRKGKKVYENLKDSLWSNVSGELVGVGGLG